MRNNHLFLQSLDLTPITFLNGIIAWEVNSVNAETLITQLGHNFEKRTVPQRRDEVYSWLELDLVLVLSNLGTGLIFESLMDADYIIPLLRLHEYPQNKSFWFLSLNQKEANEFLDNSDCQKVPIEDEENEIFFNKESGNYLSKNDGSIVFWFQKEEHFRFFMDQKRKILAML